MASTGVSSTGINLWMRSLRFRSRMRKANIGGGAFVISFPKCGRTWHRLLLGHYMTQLLGEDPREALKLGELCSRLGVPSICYTHNGTSMSDKLPLNSSVVASPIEWRNKPCLLIVRNPRDVLVSAYFHCRFREKSYDGTLSQFIRHPYVGIEKILTAFHRWNLEQGNAASFRILRYEDMSADPAQALRTTLLFAGIGEPVEKNVKTTVEFCAFGNLKQLEAEDFFSDEMMANGSGDKRARKIREGRVGGFAEYMSEEDLDFIARKEIEIGNPFYP